MCCRLRLDLRELRKKTGGFFGSGESTGSVGVVTINMPRKMCIRDRCIRICYYMIKIVRLSSGVGGKKVMRKHDGSLFQIGEVAKILGLSRKMILNYEDQGLVVPAVKDEVSGYRYYTADNMTRLRSIRTLQSLGLSLKEVAEYYYDTTNIDRHLQRLMEMRDALDKSIEMLQVRSAKSGDFTIHSVALPRHCLLYTSRCV